jgi:nicotinamide-nucleotide adenylyltransferase
MQEVGVIHGRFQVLHLDHLRYLLAGKERCRRLVVGITNPDPRLTLDDAADMKRSAPEANPLTYYERLVMTTEVLREAGLPPDEFLVTPFPVNLPELYGHYVPLDAVFFLTIYDEWGERKVELLKGAGLRTEVMWRRPLEQKGICASDVRNRMTEGRLWEHLVPEATARLMRLWRIPERLRALRCR